MKKIFSISIVLSVILIVFSCQGSPNVHPGGMNMTLTAKGEGAPPDDAENDAQAQLLACRSAKMDAYRNLAEKVHGVRIWGDTCVKDYIARDDSISSSVNGFIKNARIIKEITNSDGSCEVTIELFLGKDFESIFKEGKAKGR